MTRQGQRSRTLAPASERRREDRDADITSAYGSNVVDALGAVESPDAAESSLPSVDVLTRGAKTVASKPNVSLREEPLRAFGFTRDSTAGPSMPVLSAGMVSSPVSAIPNIIVSPEAGPKTPSPYLATGHVFDGETHYRRRRRSSRKVRDSSATMRAQGSSPDWITEQVSDDLGQANDKHVSRLRMVSDRSNQLHSTPEPQAAAMRLSEAAQEALRRILRADDENQLQ